MWFCYNGSDWRVRDIQNYALAEGSYIYEEAMWWNFGAEPQPSGTNFTDLVSFEGANVWNIYCNDTVGHENQSSVTFNIDTISPNISTANNLTDLIVSSLPTNSTWHYNATDPNIDKCYYNSIIV